MELIEFKTPWFKTASCFSFAKVKTGLSVGFIVALASCASTHDKIVGEWRYQDETVSSDYVLTKDGRFHGEVTSHGRPISRFSGYWSLEGKTVIYRYTKDSLGLIPEGSVDRDKLVKVQTDAITIEAGDGSRRRYIRVK